MPAAELRALLWDVDGTLAETERDGHRIAFNLAFERLGLGWRWDEARYVELLAVTGGRERLLHDMAGRSDAPALAGERLALAAELHRLKNGFYAERVRAGAVALRPGVVGLMAQCADQGVRMAIATTTSRANILVSLSPGATAGMFVTGTIDAGRHTVLAVPQSAVVLRDGISYVFEIGADENVVRHRVETGAYRDGLVEIVSGIQAGMSLAASGGAFLADGDRVSVAKGAE